MAQQSPVSAVSATSRLEELLHRVRLRGDFYCQVELTDPWGVTMPAIANSISFHVVTVGECTLALEGETCLQLRSGDIALVPHGRGHILHSVNDSADTPHPQCPRVDQLPQEYLGPQHSRLVHGGGGAATRLICGIVGFESLAAREMARHLPPVLVMTRESVAANSGILDSIRLMGDELAASRVGGDVVASRLADIIVVQVIRTWIAGHADAGWFTAANDDRLGPAIAAMHESPGRDWDVAALASVANVSRSLFSARFVAVVGETPMAYLTRLRMQQAQLLLVNDRLSVARVAELTGYGSEAAFSRAFRRVVGVSPGQWRRSTAEPAEALTERIGTSAVGLATVGVGTATAGTRARQR
nr:AraC family transcriptional regulator [Pseudoclavibacter sp. Marseille-Q3772]